MCGMLSFLLDCCCSLILFIAAGLTMVVIGGIQLFFYFQWQSYTVYLENGNRRKSLISLAVKYVNRLQRRKQR
jgi:hypothetical protein